jgi:Fe-S cluster assembly iron-binding protein IscA
VVAIKYSRQITENNNEATVSLVIVDAGGKAGLAVGMNLYHQFLRTNDSAVVKTLNDDQAEVEVTQKNQPFGGPQQIDSAWRFTLSPCR